MHDEEIRQKQNESEDRTTDTAALRATSRSWAALLGRESDVGKGQAGDRADAGQLAELGEASASGTGTEHPISDTIYRAALLGRATNDRTRQASIRADAKKLEKSRQSPVSDGRGTGEVQGSVQASLSRLGPALLFFPLSKGITSWRKYERTEH